jgi:APA family basic amino acid/polyamine antiporter
VRRQPRFFAGHEVIMVRASSTNPAGSAPSSEPSSSCLVAKVGLFGTTMIVMGGIIGAGIFINPYVVAQQVHSQVLILGAWAAGGIIALAGAFIYAELAARVPAVGGQYAYLRQAGYPALAFLYGWVLLFVIQTGGMAAVAITFAHYLRVLGLVQSSDALIAALALAALTLVNCLGIRPGSAVQNVLMVLNIAALAAFIVGGAWFVLHIPVSSAAPPSPAPTFPAKNSVFSFGAAMVPVLFAYAGWQTTNFIAGEIREPRKNLPRGLVLGVCGVVVLYLSFNWVCVRALGPAGLAVTTTPASAIMQLAFGRTGAALMAAAIVVSALGFLSQSILTAPRVYFAMAEDGLFFRSVAWVYPRSRVPVVAIILQGVWAIVITFSGRYDQILSYVVSMDFLFFGLTAACLFVFRRDSRPPHSPDPRWRVPGHPITTIFFIAASGLVVLNTAYKFTRNTAIGFAILAAGIPAYFLWRKYNRGEGRAS